MGNVKIKFNNSGQKIGIDIFTECKLGSKYRHCQALKLKLLFRMAFFMLLGNAKPLLLGIITTEC